MATWTGKREIFFRNAIPFRLHTYTHTHTDDAKLDSENYKGHMKGRDKLMGRDNLGCYGGDEEGESFYQNMNIWNSKTIKLFL